MPRIFLPTFSASNKSGVNAEALMPQADPIFFGEWSIADCFYAPVVFRFQSYGVTLSDAAEEYRQMMLKHPSLIELERQALAEVKET